ncbi:hypothetical protein Tco_0490344 [Tanacetum coccineum]
MGGGGRVYGFNEFLFGCKEVGDNEQYLVTVHWREKVYKSDRGESLVFGNNGPPSCQLFYFNGTEGVDGLIRWFERTESVCSHSRCAEENKVTFSTGTPTDGALSWWNADAQPMGVEQANQITWTELKSLLTNKYCPRTDVRKMEEELYNLTYKYQMTTKESLTTEELSTTTTTIVTPTPTIATIITNYNKTEGKKLLELMLLLYQKTIDLPGLLPVRQVEFQIDLIPRAAPIALTLYRLAPSEMQELSNQLQELADQFHSTK